MTRNFLRTILPVAVLGAHACGTDAPTTPDIDTQHPQALTPGQSANASCRDNPEQFAEGETFQECRAQKGAEFCERRADEALNGNQRAFFPEIKDGVKPEETFIRWPCKDVAGVTQTPFDDRGQEYCEYFAVVFPPPSEDEEMSVAGAVTLGLGNGALGVDLDDSQFGALEDDPDQIVGQCVFTSWHQDIQQPLPTCRDEESCATLKMHAAFGEDQFAEWVTELGADTKVAMTAQNFRMKIGFNSNGAAQDLVERCVVQDQPEPLSHPDTNETKFLNPEDEPGRWNYGRGCRGANDLFGTEWRKSDPTICAGAMRLGECGCVVQLKDDDGNVVQEVTDRFEIADLLIPQPDSSAPEAHVPLRGFRLGTWGDPHGLPKAKNCHYVNLGEVTEEERNADPEAAKRKESHTVVVCPITAGALQEFSADPKEFCRQEFAEDVVVHIPLPSKTKNLEVVCTPPEGVNNCGLVPWVIGAEGAVIDDDGRRRDDTDRERRRPDDVDDDRDDRGGVDRGPRVEPPDPNRPRGRVRPRDDDRARDGEVETCPTGGRVCDTLNENSKACGKTCQQFKFNCSLKSLKAANAPKAACNNSGERTIDILRKLNPERYNHPQFDVLDAPEESRRKKASDK